LFQLAFERQAEAERLARALADRLLAGEAGGAPPTADWLTLAAPGARGAALLDAARTPLAASGELGPIPPPAPPAPRRGAQGAPPGRPAAVRRRRPPGPTPRSPTASPPGCRWWPPPADPAALVPSPAVPAARGRRRRGGCSTRASTCRRPPWGRSCAPSAS